MRTGKNLNSNPLKAMLVFTGVVILAALAAGFRGTPASTSRTCQPGSDVGASQSSSGNPSSSRPIASQDAKSPVRTSFLSSRVVTRRC